MEVKKDNAVIPTSSFTVTAIVLTNEIDGGSDVAASSMHRVVCFQIPCEITVSLACAAHTVHYNAGY